MTVADKLHLMDEIRERNREYVEDWIAERTMPSRYWEPGIEETWESEEETREAEDWIAENGIPYDENLPFN